MLWINHLFFFLGGCPLHVWSVPGQIPLDASNISLIMTGKLRLLNVPSGKNSPSLRNIAFRRQPFMNRLFRDHLVAKWNLTQNLDPPGAAHTSNRSMTCTKVWPSWLPPCSNDGPFLHQSSAWGQQGLALGLISTSSSPLVYCSFFPISLAQMPTMKYLLTDIWHAHCISESASWGINLN